MPSVSPSVLMSVDRPSGWDQSVKTASDLFLLGPPTYLSSRSYRAYPPCFLPGLHSFNPLPALKYRMVHLVVKHSSLTPFLNISTQYKLLILKRNFYFDVKKKLSSNRWTTLKSLECVAVAPLLATSSAFIHSSTSGFSR